MDDKLQLLCSTIEDGGTFAVQHTGRGEDTSPAFTLENLSPVAQSLVVVLEDIQHPLFGEMAHWLLWNLPAQSEIPAGLPKGKLLEAYGGAVQGRAYGRHCYAGPKPPKGTKHTYRFTVYALDDMLDLPPKTRKGKLLAAIKPHVLQKATLTAHFE